MSTLRDTIETVYAGHSPHMVTTLSDHTSYCRRLEGLTEGRKRRSTVEIGRDGTLILAVYHPVSGRFDVVTYLPEDVNVCGECGRQVDDGGDHADTYGHFPS